MNLCLKKFIVLLSYLSLLSYFTKAFCSTEVNPTFGAELTFKSKKKEENQKDIIDKIKRKLESNKTLLDLFEISTNKTKDKFNADISTMTFKLKNESKKFPKNGFTLSFTTDPSVIEIPTSPLTLSQMNNKNIQTIFSTLFTIAAELNILPDKNNEIGGGHIHIGVQESFKDKPWASMCFLADLYNHRYFLLCGLKGKVKSASYVPTTSQIVNILQASIDCLNANKNIPNNIIIRTESTTNCFEKISNTQDTGFHDTTLKERLSTLGPKTKKKNDEKNDKKKDEEIPFTNIIGKNMSINIAGAAGFTSLNTIEVRGITPQDNPITTAALFSVFTEGILHANEKCFSLDESISYITSLRNNISKKRDSSNDDDDDDDDDDECNDEEIRNAAMEAKELVDTFKMPAFVMDAALSREAKLEFRTLNENTDCKINPIKRFETLQNEIKKILKKMSPEKINSSEKKETKLTKKNKTHQSTRKLHFTDPNKVPSKNKLITQLNKIKKINLTSDELNLYNELNEKIKAFNGVLRSSNNEKDAKDNYDEYIKNNSKKIIELLNKAESK
ncbi:MAG: hypothetical protein HQK49_04345 [Oligoflexia bacterium]|nr:hypothetical protein [Oligoflexia bacterium]